jgi:FixJ family two-component response regulator
MIPAKESIVYVVDDDWRICEALEELLATSGLACTSFLSVGPYLAHPRDERPGCLVLDVGLPDINGLDFQERIDDGHPPIVFITGHGDIPSSVRAIKGGAVNFLTKPYNDTELLASIQSAIKQDWANRAERMELRGHQERYSCLTPREREALPLVVSGLLNKQAAAQLGISDVTMQIHRSKIMQKMKAPSLADLVRMADRLHVPIRHSRAGKCPLHDDDPPSQDCCRRR